jgi:hypothetical protein
MTQEALKLALEALEANDKLINGSGTSGGLVYCMDGYYSDCFDVDPINKQIDEAVAAIKEALAQPEQEPVAWRTFDGEGGHEYRTYEENENYADDWNKRNPNHIGWVEPLYTHPLQRIELQIKLTDPFESARVGDYNRGWNDCLFASGIVKNT